jgi:hypothetical protein
MKALIFGHSQSGGMGLDMVAALKGLGFDVKRKTHNGANDAALIKDLPDLGDPAQYDRVFLYAGGNSDNPTVDQIKQLVNHFGVSKTVVILPPVNVGRKPDKVEAQRAKNKGNFDGLQGFVPVYSIEADYADFTSNTDHVHLRAGSKPSVDLVAKVLTDLGLSKGGALATSSATKTVLIIGGAVLIAIVLALMTRARGRR